MSNEIYVKLNLIMQEMKAIGKNNTNPHQHYQFRGIDDVYNELHKLFAKHGVIVLPCVVEDSVKAKVRTSNRGSSMMHVVLNVRYTFAATDGSTVEVTTRGEGMDSGDKATNKAMSAAMKYALIQTFLIPTYENEDSEFDSPEFSSNSTSYTPKQTQSYTPSRKPVPQPKPNAETKTAFDVSNVPKTPPPCPSCGGKMYAEIGNQYWGNGLSRNGKQKPVFKCMDKSCNTGIWAREYDKKPDESLIEAPPVDDYEEDPFRV